MKKSKILLMIVNSNDVNYTHIVYALNSKADGMIDKHISDNDMDLQALGLEDLAEGIMGWLGESRAPEWLQNELISLGYKSEIDLYFSLMDL